MNLQPVPSAAMDLRPPLSAFAQMSEACHFDTLLHSGPPQTWAFQAAEKPFFYKEEVSPMPDVAATAGQFADFYSMARSPVGICDGRDSSMWQQWGPSSFYLPEPSEPADYLSRHTGQSPWAQLQDEGSFNDACWQARGNREFVMVDADSSSVMAG